MLPELELVKERPGTTFFVRVLSLRLDSAAGIDAKSKHEALGHGCAEVVGLEWCKWHETGKNSMIRERRGHFRNLTDGED